MLTQVCHRDDGLPVLRLYPGDVFELVLGGGLTPGPQSRQGLQLSVQSEQRNDHCAVAKEV